MNIFAFDPSPAQSALWLDDVRQNKMMLETAQMLSTAMRINDPGMHPDVYKSNHINHPCSVWVRQSRGNFSWLVEYMKCLQSQRTTPHSSTELLTYFDKYLESGWFPLEEQTPFANCAAHQELGLNFKHMQDVPKAYQLYITERWKMDTIKLSWNMGQKPEWC